LIRGIKNVEVAAQRHPLAIAAQEQQAVAVERAHRGGKRVDANQVLDPLAHFARRLVGEGHGGDVPGVDAHLFDKPEDAVGDDPGFAGPGAGEDELRPHAVGDGGDLLRVELDLELLGDVFLHGGSLSEGRGNGKAAAGFLVASKQSLGLRSRNRVMLPRDSGVLRHSAGKTCGG
jgi:hypothetical protein